MNSIRKIYFMGIKGVGMATLAVIAKDAGFIVAGSDIDDEFITDKILKDSGIEIKTGFDEQNIKDFLGTSPISECLFIATGAHEGFYNPETEWAREKGIKVISHGQAVGLFMSGELFDKSFDGISVAGSHGKTTITAMIATVLKEAGLSPSFTAGTSEIFPLGAAGHLGEGKYFVAEADEYVSEKNFDHIAKFLYQKPSAMIINNIDFDHPDFYENIEAIQNAYAEFASNLPDSGLLVVNGDDRNTLQILPKIGSRPKIIKFGAGEGNEFIIKDFKENAWGSNFKVLREETEIGEFSLSVPGYYNAKNALGVIALLMELGVSIQKIEAGLKNFKGVKRRQEIVGETKNGQMVIDDYGHHPEEIKKTVEAIRIATGKKVLVIFQFHTFSRTRALFADFVSSFTSASEIIIVPTFSAKRGEESEEDIDRQFVEQLHKVNPHAIFINSLENVVEYIEKNVFDPGFVIVTMGAGDVYKIGEKLVKNK